MEWDNVVMLLIVVVGCCWCGHEETVGKCQEAQRKAGQSIQGCR
jgi:hypothetical protein